MTTTLHASTIAHFIYSIPLPYGEVQMGVVVLIMCVYGDRKVFYVFIYVYQNTNVSY